MGSTASVRLLDAYTPAPSIIFVEIAAGLGELATIGLNSNQQATLASTAPNVGECHHDINTLGYIPGTLHQ